MVDIVGIPYGTLAWLLWYIQWEGLPTRSKASQVKHCSHPVFCKKTVNVGITYTPVAYTNKRNTILHDIAHKV